jgi:nicotinamide mononucleotide adenylyltransferase
MAKTNTERQAEFRARMREEGKQALHVWVSPAQATQIQALLAGVPPATLPAKKVSAPVKQTLQVTAGVRKIVLPSIPSKTPVSIAHDLKEQEKVLRKKIAQIEKLERDTVAIERRFRETVATFGRL